MRDDFATCPRCQAGLDAVDTRLSCGRCRGVLVVERELLSLISDAQVQALLTSRRRDPWRREEFARAAAFEPPEVAEAPLQCPRCVAQMAKHTLYGVLVDRCPAHGVWLDDEHELRRVFDNAAARI